jgi:nicotinate-nucleotide pyrophosphorylase (carboxylating)
MNTRNGGRTLRGSLASHLSSLLTPARVARPAARQNGWVVSREIDDLVARALAEDVGAGDLTTEAVVPAGTQARARIEQKAPGIVFGLDVAEAVFRRLDPQVSVGRERPEGEWLEEPPAVVLTLAGDARALLTGERTALNFLAHLSGIATATARAVHELRGTGVTVLDTRKTTPGLRALEKQAVAAGGGRNHRLGLHDAILVKDNHIALAGGVGEATRRALEGRPPGIPVEVECASLADVEEAIAAGADRLLLDNMDAEQLRAAAARVAGSAALEASGGITQQGLGNVGGTGVEFVSLGALTHSAPALDLSMTIEPSSDQDR